MVNRILFYAFGISCLVFGCVLGGALEKGVFFKSEFYAIKITDILQLVVAIFIALYVTYYVNRKNSNEQKQKEIILSSVDELRAQPKISWHHNS